MSTAKQRGYYTPVDVKNFLRERDASPMAWTMFVTLIVAMILVLVIFVAPGWAWALEVHTHITFEGSMYGYYGLWFSCWTLSDNYWEETRTDCELMLDLKKIPFWWKICQGISLCLLFIGVVVLAVTGSYCYVKYFAKNIKIVIAIIIMVVIEALLTVALFTVWCVLFLNSAYWCCPSGAMQMIEWKLHYCFVLACVLPAFFIAVAFMAAKEIHILRSPLRLQQYQRKVASTRRSDEGAYREVHPGPDMMTYHPGVQESYQPKFVALNQNPQPNGNFMHTAPVPEPELDLHLRQASEREKQPMSPTVRPLGPNELDLTQELAY